MKSTVKKSGSPRSKQSLRVQAVPSLTLSRRFEQLSVDRAGEQIHWLDSQGHIVYANPAMCSSLGYTQAELKSLSLFDIDPDVTPAHWETGFAELRAVGSRTFETRHRTKAGMCFEVQVIADYIELDGQAYCCAFSRDISERVAVETSLLQTQEQLADKVSQRTRELEQANVRLRAEITERQRAEQDLAQERNLLRTVIEQLPDYIYLKDTQGRLQLVNASQMELVGAGTPEQVLGKTDFDLFPRALATKYHRDEQNVIQTGRILLNVEEPCLDSTGRIRWTLTTKVPLYDQDGVITGLVGIGRDITERKKMEEAQARERNLMHTFLDNLPSCVYAKDPGSRYTLANAANLRVMGASSMDEVIGKLPFDFFPPEIAQELVEQDRQVIQTGIPIINREVLMFDCEKGESVMHSVIKLPLRDEDGNIIGLVGMSQDITERKRAAEQLAAEKEQLAVTLSSIGDGVITTDIEQRIVLFNPKAEQLTGWSSAEAVGKNLGEVFHLVNNVTDQQADVLARRVIETGSATGLKQGTCLVARDGKEYVLSASIAPVRDNARQVFGVVVVFRDITFIKRTEKALEEARQAEAANQAKSQFLAHMSHEIRTPIHGISGLTTLILKTDLSNEQRQYIDMIQSSADLLLGLVNDILDLSRIEAGRLELEAMPFDLRSLVAQVMDTSKLLVRSRDLDLELEILPNVPGALVGDPVRLRQILLNLISNAIKFTDRGSITVRVAPDDSKEADTAQEAHILISVEDTGIGIAAEKQVSIFEAFRQSDNSTTRKYGGSGLGLTISRQLVELMGGRMWLDSVPGKGSTFFLTLVLQKQTETESPLSEQEVVSPRQEAGTEVSLGGLDILLVEDNAVNQIVGKKMLEQNGHRVELASNGIEAAQKHRNGRYDVILMDVEMPVMDGLEATRRIRQREAAQGLRRTPILAVTAYASTTNRNAAYEAGMDGYLSKPFKMDKLRECLVPLVGSRPTSPYLPAFDPTIALEAVGGSQEILQEVVQVFLTTDLPRHLGDLQAAVSAHDGERLRKAAHGLKGALLTLGGTKTAAIALQLQELGVSGSFEFVPPKLQELEQEIKVFIRDYENSRQNASRAPLQD